MNTRNEKLVTDAVSKAFENPVNTPAVAALMSSAAACLLLAAIEEEEEPQSKRSCWIKPYRKSRKTIGDTHYLIKELKPIPGDYKNYLRMDEDSFNFILLKIKNDIKRNNTHLRDAISAEEKLAITLRFLATGESYMELDYSSKLSKSFLSMAVLEVCDSIYKNLSKEFLKFPTTEEDWLKIADEYKLKYQFPNCIGALDGKHIGFRPAKTNVPLFYNYKGFHSVILLGLADAYAKFIFIDVGCNGRVSDGGALQRSNLNNILQQADNYLPPKKLVGNRRVLPHVIVADNAFSLTENIITPYPFTTTDEDKKTFNFRLSRARQTIERAFGILSNRFQICQKTINLHEDKVVKIVMCCCVLHNFLITKSTWYKDSIFSEEYEALQRKGIGVRSNPNSTKSGDVVRKQLTEYFNNEGRI